MARDGELIERIIAHLIANRDEILKDHQSKYCGPCGGSRVDLVYRNPASYLLGVMLDEHTRNTNHPTE